MFFIFLRISLLENVVVFLKWFLKYMALSASSSSSDSDLDKFWFSRVLFCKTLLLWSEQMKIPLSQFIFLKWLVGFLDSAPSTFVDRSPVLICWYFIWFTRFPSSNDVYLFVGFRIIFCYLTTSGDSKFISIVSSCYIISSSCSIYRPFTCVCGSFGSSASYE